MKAHSSYFQRKNSKKGLALSTALAICIVLALLVAVLVSMAALNITTTQSTVSQREAYIQAKSALAFAESYYAKHADQIPGNSSSNGMGSGIIIFKTATVADGAKIYQIQSGDDPAFLTQKQVDDMKSKKEVDTYVEVSNTASVLDLTAFCRYGDNNYYTLSKEYDFRNSTDVRPNAFTGNIVYRPTSDRRYLRIHVRTDPAFGEQPYIWTWYTTTNGLDGNAAASAKGGSSIVNKMSEDGNYKTITNGYWSTKPDPETGETHNGPVGNVSMIYEGNRWYVHEITFNKNDNVNFVNAIVTKRKAFRTMGDNYQSWEFFGIPVPSKKATGQANGVDVYITLNKSQLRDARNDGDSDEFTSFFENKNDSDVDKFAQWCGTYYTVYTKKDIATIHYKKAGEMEEKDLAGNRTGPSDFTYEGYGWWRKSTNDFGAYIPIAGQNYYYSQGNLISSNKITGKERVVESYIVEYSPGMGSTEVQRFNTEEEANDWLVNHCGDSAAAQYVTVNVRANQQPVNTPIPTTISYKSKWGESEEVPVPEVPSTPPADPTPEPASAENEELKIQELASEDKFAVVGTFNDWGSGDYSNIDQNLYVLHKDSTVGFDYSLTVENVTGGDQAFKVIRMVEDSGPIQWHGNSWGNGTDVDNGNVHVNVAKSGNNIVIKFNSQSGSLTGKDQDPENTVSSGKKYMMASWENDFGKRKDGTTYSTNCYAGTEEMTDNNNGTFTFNFHETLSSTSSLASSGGYKFKICEWDTDSKGEMDGIDWTHTYGGRDNYTNSTGDYVINLPPNGGTYTAVCKFDENAMTIEVELKPTTATDDNFYVIGDFNNWGNNHSFSYATNSQFMLQPQGQDEYGRYIYKAKIPTPQEGGSHEIKVISSKAGTEGSDEINYAESWGTVDANGVTKGSAAGGYVYTLTERSTVEVTFTYLTSQTDASTISVSSETYDPENRVGTANVGFHNAQVKNDKDDTKKTDFVNAWSEVWVTYIGTNSQCEKVEGDGSSLWHNIPSDALFIYFSNMNSLDNVGKPGYQYTEDIPLSKFDPQYVSNPFFFPISSSTTTKGTMWTVGDAEAYRDYVTNITDKSGTDLVMAGTSTKGSGTEKGVSGQKNFYDAPIVKVLNMLVTGHADGGGSKYAFSAYPYSSFDVTGGGVGTVSFSASQYKVYQGETYYYTSCGGYDGKYSFLIIQDTSKGKGGILLENHMALMTDVYGGVATKMDNRGGGIFTSDYTYYDGSNSPFNYQGYTPDWYTYKIPVTTELMITNIKGVTKSGDNYFTGTGYFTPANKSAYYKQPIYIEKDSDNTLRYFTFDTKTGSVDTDTDNNVTIYFRNDDNWPEDQIYLHYYNIKGESHNTKLSRDTTDVSRGEGNGYFSFKFTRGEFTYFQFFDGSSCTGDKKIENATRYNETPLFLTGYEDPNTRECQLLCGGSTSTEFELFIHPRTQAVYAANALMSAKTAAQIPKEYTFNPADGTFTDGDTYSMKGVSDLAKNAENAAKNGNAGTKKWAYTDPKAYDELASTIGQFVDVIQSARIYIGDDPEELKTANRTSGPYVFKEALARDDTVVYETRWVSALKNVYADALKEFDSGVSSPENKTQNLCKHISRLTKLINNPEADLNKNASAVQIIVDDQISVDSSGNATGGWGRDNIHLYNYDTNQNKWVDVGYDLYDTTQSDEGFYAYVFKLQIPGDFYMVSDGTAPESANDKMKLEKGKRYIYHTATRKLEPDKSIYTVNCTYPKIEQGDFSEAYATYRSREAGKEFIIYFYYDTTVKYSGQTYTIYAGAYNISNRSYKNFKTDIPKDPGAAADDPKPTGINLFTEEAKKFFTSPAKYGMSEATSYAEWNGSTDVNMAGKKKNVSFMCNGITIEPTATGVADDSKKFSFRYKANYDESTFESDDTLTLNQDVDIRGGVVSMAVNNVVMNGHSFKITAKTITFQTDTMVYTDSGKKFRIAHGTYIFNETGSSTSYTIDLKDTGAAGDADWRKRFTLIDEVNTNLGGGTYIAKR